MSDLDGEDMFDDFLNSRMEDDHLDGGNDVNGLAGQSTIGDDDDEEFEKLLNESETENVVVGKESMSSNEVVVDSTTFNNQDKTSNIKKEEQETEDNDDEVIEFSWTDEDYNKDETDQVNQNTLISEIKMLIEQPAVVVTSSTTTTSKPAAKQSENKDIVNPLLPTSTTTSGNNSTNAAHQESVKSQEIIETRISVMISDVLNRFGKVIDIDSRSDAIENRIKHLKEEDASTSTDSEFTFGSLKDSVQRKLVVLECAVENLCVLVEKNVQRKLKLRDTKNILKEQLKTNIERYSEKCTQLDEQKEKYSTMESLWEKDRKNLLEIIEKLKEQVESKDPENDYLKSMKIPEAPSSNSDDNDNNTLSNLTKSLLSLPETWKSSSTDSNLPPSSPSQQQQSNSTTSSSTATTSSNSTLSESNKIDPLAKASSWLSSWMK